MAHLVSVEPHGHIIRVKVLGRLGQETYAHLVPFIDTAIAEFDGVRVLFDLSQYAGREPGESFEDAEFSLPHWAEVERVAIIGGKHLEPRVVAFCEPFSSATVRFFYPNQVKAAEEWIHEDVE
ncbi:MAG: SpoIIAA family protein [Planctomycetota bacterium]|jgi:hypothetical protein